MSDMVSANRRSLAEEHEALQQDFSDLYANFNRLAKERDDLREALTSIAALGGNLPDDRLETATGPNDARQRGMMYTAARQIANKALANLNKTDPET